MFKTIFTALSLLLIIATPTFAEGDVKAGKKVFKKCKACHTVKQDKHKSGPSLYNIVGSNSGRIAEFKYSDAMANADLTWDEATLREFLTKPKDLVPGNKMAFSGLKKEKQIDDVIAYLKSVAAK